MMTAGNIVHVFTLSNTEEMSFVGLAPKLALVAAYESGRGNMDTSTYPYRLAHYERTGQFFEGLATIALGDYAVRTRVLH